MFTIRVSSNKEECQDALIRLKSPEVESIAHSAETGRLQYNKTCLTTAERKRFAQEFRRIVKVPLEAREELAKAYEKVLGKTYEQIIEEDIQSGLRYTNRLHGSNS